VEHLVVAQVVQPVQGRLPAQQAAGVEEERATRPISSATSSNTARPRAGVQQRVLVEGAPEVEGVEPEAV
jgi:hypothetical protein